MLSFFARICTTSNPRTARTSAISLRWQRHHRISEHIIAVRNPQDAFMECVRVISCGSRAAACGRELTRQNRAMACADAMQRCMVVYPVPQ